MDSTSADVAPRRNGAGGRARGRVSADDAIVKALDHVFEPLDDLRHERFHTESRSGDVRPATAAEESTVSGRQTPAEVRRAAPLRLLLLRLRYSRRAPYRQLRGASVWGACIAVTCTVAWLIIGHPG
jgi:hypothetical protein